MDKFTVTWNLEAQYDIFGFEEEWAMPPCGGYGILGDMFHAQFLDDFSEC